jgi:PAS domain S-box-containing protein
MLAPIERIGATRIVVPGVIDGRRAAVHSRTAVTSQDRRDAQVRGMPVLPGSRSGGHVKGTPASADGAPLDATARLGTATAAAWFGAFMQYSPAGAAVRDSDGAHHWVNNAFLHVLDVPADRILGSGWAEFQPDEMAERLAATDQRVLSTQAPLRWRLPFQRADGEGELAGFSFPVVLTQGRPGVGSSFTDTTDTKRLRDRLATSEHLYRSLFERSGVPIAVFGLDQRVRDANPAYCRMLGYRPDEMRGTHVRHLITRATAVATSDRWLAVVAGELDGYRTVTTGVRKDGSAVSGQTIVSLVRTAAGDPELIYAVSDPAILTADGEPVEPIAANRFELSLREIDVLEGVAEGQSSVQVARRLGMSSKGVDYHVSKLGELLGVPTRTGMVARAYAVGLLVSGVWPPRVAAHVAEGRRRPTV